MKESRSDTIRGTISKIVYATIKKWTKSKRFGQLTLESYDNWKDDLVDKLVNYTSKEQTEIKKDLEIWNSEMLKHFKALPPDKEADAENLKKVHSLKLEGRKLSKKQKDLQAARLRRLSKYYTTSLHKFRRANIRVKNW